MSDSEIATSLELLQLDFEGVEAQDSDVPTMSKLLEQMMRETEVDTVQLAKILVSQNYIGSVLKPCIDDVDYDDNEDPEDQAVYAITSIVNLTSRKESVIPDIVRFVRESIQTGAVKPVKESKVWAKIYNEDGMTKDVTLGLLIKERMINMPVDLLHPSMSSLLGDIDRAANKGMPYKFTHLLYFSKMYLNQTKFEHLDREDSWFDENAIDYFNFLLKKSDTVMVPTEDGEAEGATQVRRVYVLEYSKLESFMDHLKDVGQQ